LGAGAMAHSKTKNVKAGELQVSDLRQNSQPWEITALAIILNGSHDGAICGHGPLSKKPGRSSSLISPSGKYLTLAKAG
jgi:hypothetical protein